jgi:excisionase family DNA binding protein
MTPSPKICWDDMPDVMTAQEVAHMLRISPDHLYGLASQAKIPCLRVGRALRFSKAQLLQWMHQEMSWDPT